MRTRPGGATPAHFTKHLRAKRDFGGLGVHPGRPDRPKGERAQWFTTWFALDLDGTKPPQLEDFLIELMHHDLMAYPSTGTTGGGSHLWFFLESPIPVAVAHKLALSLAELARAHGAQTVEVRPSAPYGPGSGILLPYRGAAADGYGFNPLLEPLGDYSPISMEQLETIHLNSLEAVEAVMLQPRTERTKPRQRTSVEHPEARWADELERLGPLWLRGRRNALTLGATSFGLHLGIDPERVKSDVLALVRAAHDDQRERARTIDTTLKRWNRLVAGDLSQRVAFRCFYVRAGVPQPSSECLGPETRERLNAMRKAVLAKPWPGRAGGLDQRLLLELISLAQAHGGSSQEGVAVSVSTRQLAERTNTSRAAADRAIQRLIAYRLITREARGGFEQAGVLVLKWDILLTPLVSEALASEASTPPPPHLPEEQTNEDAVLHAFHALPARASNVLFSISRAKITGMSEVAAKTGLSQKSARRHIAWLLERGLIVPIAEGFAVAEDAIERAQAYAIANGEAQKKALRRERHERERQAFREHRLGQKVLNQPAPTDRHTPTPRPHISTTSSDYNLDDIRAMFKQAAVHPYGYATVLERLADPSHLKRATEILGEAFVLDIANLAVVTKGEQTKPLPRERGQRSPFPPEPPATHHKRLPGRPPSRRAHGNPELTTREHLRPFDALEEWQARRATESS